MSTLIIQYNDQSFSIKGKDILQLELKLNLTEKAREYSKIGDHLYLFYTKEGCEGQPCDILKVNQLQYNFLFTLHHKSYQDVWSENH